MPAKAGIQGLQVGALGYSSWIPALRLGSPVPAALAQAGQASAGMTPPYPPFISTWTK